MPADTYMKIEGIPGESADDKHKDWIEVVGFVHEFTQPASATESSAGGATIGRLNMMPFSITKLVDKASPKLYEYCCSGKHLQNVTIEMMRASGDNRVKYLEIKMEQAIVERIQNGRVGSDQFPTETVSFNFAKIKWTYTQQKREDGSSAGNVTGGWDLAAHKTYA